MYAWPSMMPVEGESNARSATSAGSSARASAPLCQAKSVTPLVSACALIAASFSISPAFVATKSVPHRRDAEALAKVVDHRLAVNAQPRLVEAGRMVDACMNLLAVARTGARTDVVFALDHNNLPTIARQSTGDHEPNDASADDETLDRVHPSGFQSEKAEMVDDHVD
jgi:hypothetical protein